MQHTDFKGFVQNYAQSDRALVEDNTPHSKAKKPSWPAWSLRRALLLMHLPWDYVRSLSDDGLCGVVADYFGLCNPNDDPHVFLAARLGSKLNADLHRGAAKLGVRMLVPIEDPRMSGRAALAHNFAETLL